MHPRDKCFRCGKDIYNTAARGQITVSGYYSASSPAYYHNFHLCEDCHMQLNRALNDCIFGGNRWQNQ